MRRPFALVGFTYLLAQVAAVFLGASWALLMACVLLLLMGGSLLLPRLRTGIFPVVLCAASLAFGGFAAFAPAVTAPGEALDGTDAVISGTMEEAPYRSYGNRYCTVHVETLNGQEADFAVRLSVPQTVTGEAGFHVEGSVHFYLPRGGAGFSSRNYYASQDISICAYLDGYEPYTVTPPGRKTLSHRVQDLRAALGRSVDFLLPEEDAGLLKGVLMGDKSGVDPALTEDFRTVGLSHLMAVSGLHMTIMVNLLLACLALLHVPRKARALLASCGALLFMAVANFAPSASRSGAMCLLFLAGSLVSRRADSLNSLGFAVWVLCLLSPYAGADVGLLLSFSATLGLILCSGPLCAWLDVWAPGGRWSKRLFHAVNLVLSTSISAAVFTLPVMAVTFRSVSLVSLLANILTLWPATFLLQFGMGAAVLQLLIPGTLAALPLALPAGWLANYLCGCVHWLAQIPYASLPLSMGFVPLWLGLAFFLLALCVYFGRSKRLLKTTALLSAILLLAGMFSYQLSRRDVTRIAVTDTGTGLSVAITRNGRAAVLGCEGYASKALQEELRSQGIRELDCLLLFSHFGEEAHNAAELLQTIPAEKLVLPAGYPDDFLQWEADRAEERLLYQEHARLVLWENVAIETAGGAAFLEAEGVTVLFYPAGTEIGQLPEEWRTPDFAVLAQDSTEVSADYTILSMRDADAGEAALGKQQTAATAGAGTVAVEITGKQTCTIRRDA